ncbi:retrovirus-related pol polyprotein from transposon TNT 1-94 [Tanacetum coccineum]
MLIRRSIAKVRYTTTEWYQIQVTINNGRRWHALGVVRLSLAKNVAYNVVNEKTTYGLIKALSNMLMSVDIKFDDEVQALLLLSSLPESWPCIVTAISGSTETTKLKFNNIRDLILREDIRRKTSSEYSNSLLSAKDKDRGRKQDRGQKQNRGISKSKKRGIRRLTWQLEILMTHWYVALKIRLRIVLWILVHRSMLPIARRSYRGSLVVARGNKRGSMYMLEVPSDEINTSIDSKGNTALWHQRLAHMSENGYEDSSFERIGMLKTILEIPQQNGVAERINQTLNERSKSMRLHAGLPKRFWGAKAATNSSNLTKPNQKDQVVLEDSPENLANNNIIIEHRLSSKINQSTDGSSNTSEGSKNSGSFEDSGRSYEEDSEDRASSEEGGSETPQNGEPESYLEALSSKESVQWKKAINEEISLLEKNQTWSLVRLPSGKNALQSKWVFRVKEEYNCRKRYKARLVVKGFQQMQGVDYNDIFSPIVKMTTIRLVLSIVASEDLHLEQLYAKTTFLHGDLNEDIYMTQIEGFQLAKKEKNLVCKLKKILYGLKQAPRQWYLKFDSFMQRTCSDMAEIKKLKRKLSQEIKMKDFGSAK